MLSAFDVGSDIGGDGECRDESSVIYIWERNCKKLAVSQWALNDRCDCFERRTCSYQFQRFHMLLLMHWWTWVRLTEALIVVALFICDEREEFELVNLSRTHGKSQKIKTVSLSNELPFSTANERNTQIKKMKLTASIFFWFEGWFSAFILFTIGLLLETRATVLQFMYEQKKGQREEMQRVRFEFFLKCMKWKVRVSRRGKENMVNCIIRCERVKLRRTFRQFQQSQRNMASANKLTNFFIIVFDTLKLYIFRIFAKSYFWDSKSSSSHIITTDWSVQIQEEASKKNCWKLSRRNSNFLLFLTRKPFFYGQTLNAH